MVTVVFAVISNGHTFPLLSFLCTYHHFTPKLSASCPHLLLVCPTVSANHLPLRQETEKNPKAVHLSKQRVNRLQRPTVQHKLRTTVLEHSYLIISVLKLPDKVAQRVT